MLVITGETVQTCPQSGETFILVNAMMAHLDWIHDGVTIPIYMSGTIICADNSSPTQKQLEDCPLTVLTSHHDWDPHSVSKSLTKQG